MDTVQGPKMIIYMLAECPQCGTRYAVAPDPYSPGQWIFFERDHSIEEPTHICVGGLLCRHGHALEVKAEEAALTRDGDWLTLSVGHPEPALN